MAEIFISYSREDAVAVRRIAERLAEAGYDLWWDRKLGGGAYFAKEIEEQLSVASAVIVVWSEAAASSHWVVDEASSGRDAGKLIPISLDGTLPPLGFRQMHTISFAGSLSDQAFEDLKQAINQKIRGTSASDAASKVPSPRSPEQLPARALWRDARERLAGLRRPFIAALVALLIGGGVAILMLRGPALMSGPAARADAERADSADQGDHASGAAVAILPFHASNTEAAEPADRLYRSLAAALTRAPWLSVESARSVAAAAAEETDLSKMAAMMDVAYLVDGEVDPVASGFRLTLQVVDARTTETLWSISQEFPSGRLSDQDLVEQLAHAVWRSVHGAAAAGARNKPLDALAPREVLALSMTGVRNAPWTEEGVKESIEILSAAVDRYPNEADILAASAQAELAFALVDPARAPVLQKAAEDKLAKAYLLDPQSRWVESVAADARFAAGRYYAAAEGYDRLVRRGLVLPATLARQLDARARIAGGFVDAARAADVLAQKAITPLQRSQTQAAAAYMSAAAGADAAALDYARNAVAAFPNNPDAVMALVMTAMLAGEEGALAASARSFCSFYPSYRFPEPGRSGALRAQLEGDGGAEWRAFIARLFDAYAERWPTLQAACE